MCFESRSSWEQKKEKFASPNSMNDSRILFTFYVLSFNSRARPEILANFRRQMCRQSIVLKRIRAAPPYACGMQLNYFVDTRTADITQRIRTYFFNLLCAPLRIYKLINSKRNDFGFLKSNLFLPTTYLHLITDDNIQ